MAARVLVLIPAHNEAQTIADVLSAIRSAAPDFDRLVVNDGSTDATGAIVDQVGETQLRLPCNLGYGRALQTGLRYAIARDYEIVAFIDADGQHTPTDVPRLIKFLDDKRADVVIGSRFCGGRPYTGPLSRRWAQNLLSHLTGALTGRRIFDTTSGLKALRAPAYTQLVSGTFQDFHLESLVRLSLLGFNVVEMPIEVKERSHGQSMYSALDFVEYPMKTLLLTLVAAVDAVLARRNDDHARSRAD
jgi:glycosyltransferase involved in cell wall biosynthesis